MAVRSLSDPSISDLNFLSDIIEVLATHVSPPSRSLALIYSFFTSTGLQLSEARDRDIKLLSIASAGSLFEAFKLVRSHTDAEERTRMRSALWCWMLGAPNIPCGAGQGGVQTKSSKEMLHIPLNPEEHHHLIFFLSSPPRLISPPALSAFHDLVTLRLIHQGQYAETLELDKASAGSAGSDVDRQRRREMVREFIGILPAVQRRALAVDGDHSADERGEGLGMEKVLVNGFGQAQEGYDSSRTWQAAVNKNQPSPPPASVVPLPRSPAVVPNGGMKASSSHVSLAPSGSASPAPRRPQSPFTGPPRFAPSTLGPTSPAPFQRVLSGSPFALPSSRVVSTHGSPAPRVRRVIDDDDDDMGRGGGGSPLQRVLSGASIRSKRGSDAARPISEGQQTPNIQQHAAEQRADEPMGEAEPEQQGQMEPARVREVADQPTPEASGEARAGAQSSRRQTRQRAPRSVAQAQAVTAPEPVNQETTPPPPSPPPSPPSHHTRSHDTPSSPHSPPAAAAEPTSTTRPPRSTRARRAGRRSMPGAFDPHEEPTIPEDSELPPTPAPTTTRRVTAQTEPARNRMTRSSSRRKMDEEELAVPPKRAKRNIRESSVVSAVSAISERSGGDRGSRAGSVVRRSARRTQAVAAGTATRSRVSATPTSELGTPTPSAAASARGTSVEPMRIGTGTGRRGRARTGSATDGARDAAPSTRTTRRRG